MKTRLDRMARSVRGMRGVRGGVRLAAAATLASAALLLAGCGGGGDDAFYVSAYVSGQATGGSVYAGQRSSITIAAGQTIELDAAEPVVWTLYVDGAALSGSGTVYARGIGVQQTAIDESRIVVRTGATGALGGVRVPLTFVATSTWDDSEVAIVDVWVTM